MTSMSAKRSAVVVPLPASIDLTNCDRVYSELYAAVISSMTVVIADFSKTRFCDCASLRGLVAVQQRAAAFDGQLRVVIPVGSPVERLADLLDLKSRLLIYPSTRRASAWLPRLYAPVSPIAS